jgi:hypothetical protein
MCDALCASDLAGLHALGADLHPLDVTVDDSRDLLDVGTEDTVGHPVRVADVTARHGVLATDFADLRHFARSSRVLIDRL